MVPADANGGGFLPLLRLAKISNIAGLMSRPFITYLVPLGLFLLACSPEPSNPGEENDATGGADTAGDSGGSMSSGGESSGGNSSGGESSGGNSSGGSEASGGADGTGGGDFLSIAQPLEGLRIDDPCAGNPTVTVGATCDHSVLTAGGFNAEEVVSIGGTEGTIYEVTLRIRGVVEPTNIVGGSRPDTSTFEYMSLDWRSAPFTIGGAVPGEDADYAQWSIRVASPEQEYFLNDYQRVGHYIFALDYEVVIPIEGNSTVTLAAFDDNERQILNYENYTIDGLAGSVNHGQFVELAVVSVVPQ
jgi:hypothetical protein